MPNALPSPSTLRTPGARNPQDMITSSTPWRRSHSSMCTMNGRSTSGTTGLGTVDVSGRRRVPSPPTRITACTGWSSQGGQGCQGPAPDALVEEPGGADAGGVERVAPVHDEPAAHRARDLAPVEVAELLPLGDEHDRVGVLERPERPAGELDP